MSLISQILLSPALIAVLALTPACRGSSSVVTEVATYVDDVARAYEVSADDAARMVSRVANEASISSESAAARLLDEADVVVRTDGDRIDFAAFLQRANELAEEAFDAALASTYCHAIFTFRTTGNVDAKDIYSTLYQDFGEAIADKLWGLGYVADAVNVAYSIAKGDPSGAALIVAEMSYCR